MEQVWWKAPKDKYLVVFWTWVLSRNIYMFYCSYQYKNNRNIKLAPEQKLTLERNSQQRYRRCPWHPVQYSVWLYCTLQTLSLPYNTVHYCTVLLRESMHFLFSLHYFDHSSWKSRVATLWCWDTRQYNDKLTEDEWPCKWNTPPSPDWLFTTLVCGEGKFPVWTQVQDTIHI